MTGVGTASATNSGATICSLGTETGSEQWGQRTRLPAR